MSLDVLRQQPFETIRDTPITVVGNEKATAGASWSSAVTGKSGSQRAGASATPECMKRAHFLF